MAKGSLEGRGRCKRSKQKKNHDTFTIRWQDDEQYRESQLSHGWTGEYCKYLDHLKTFYIANAATWKQRHRYERTITLDMTTKDPTDALIGLRQEQGRENPKIPKNERTRQRPFDDRLQAKLEWLSQHCRTDFAQPSSSSSSSHHWWKHKHEHEDSQWHGHQNTQQRDHQWQGHGWSENLARSWKQSVKVPSDDRQDYQW